MRILLSLLSAAFFVVFAALFALHVIEVVFYTAEGTDTRTQCVTPAPTPNGPTVETCDGRDQVGTAISNAVYGGASLLASATFGVGAAVSGRSRSAAPPTWTPTPGPVGGP